MALGAVLKLCTSAGLQVPFSYKIFLNPFTRSALVLQTVSHMHQCVQQKILLDG